MIDSHIHNMCVVSSWGQNGEYSTKSATVALKLATEAVKPQKTNDFCQPRTCHDTLPFSKVLTAFSS